MKRKDITALHEKTLDELSKMLAELQQELLTARVAHKAGKLEDTASIARLSDDIARVKTVMTELSKKEIKA